MKTTKNGPSPQPGKGDNDNNGGNKGGNTGDGGTPSKPGKPGSDPDQTPTREIQDPPVANPGTGGAPQPAKRT